MYVPMSSSGTVSEELEPPPQPHKARAHRPRIEANVNLTLRLRPSLAADSSEALNIALSSAANRSGSKEANPTGRSFATFQANAATPKRVDCRPAWISTSPSTSEFTIHGSGRINDACSYKTGARASERENATSRQANHIA